MSEIIIGDRPNNNRGQTRQDNNRGNNRGQTTVSGGNNRGQTTVSE
jgi:hypothetical protein